MKKNHYTIIIGSGHRLFVPWEYASSMIRFKISPAVNTAPSDLFKASIADLLFQPVDDETWQFDLH